MNLWTTLVVLPPLLLLTHASDTIFKARAVLDLAEAFNSACLRFIHGDVVPFDMDYQLNFLRTLFKHQRSTSSFITMGSVSFERYLMVADRFHNGDGSCYTPFHVFHATDETQTYFYQVNDKYMIADSKWLIFMTEENQEKLFFQNIVIPFNAHILTATQEGEGFTIREVYRVNNNSFVESIHIGYWTVSSRLKINLNFMYHRRSDLLGTILRVGSIQNWPMTSFLRPFNDSPPLDGFFAQVWFELQGIMNFSSIILRSIDNTTGTMLTPGNWTGLMGMIVRGDIDVVVSELNMNKERIEILQFSKPLMITSYQVYFQLDGFSLSWTAVFHPFNFFVWLAILVWIVLGTMSLSTCYTASKPFTSHSDMSLQPKTTIFFILQSLCQQGYSQVPESLACRLIFLLSYLLSAILIPCYAASLISSLTSHSPQLPFDSLKGMLSNGKYKLLLGKNTAEYSLFALAKDALYSSVYEKLLKPVDHMLNSMNSAIALELVCGNTGRFAVFGVESIFNLRVEKKSIERPECHIMKFSQPLSKVYQGIALSKDHPYTDLINYHIQRMFQTGVIPRIRKNFWPITNMKFENSFKQVQSNDVFQIFACLIVGLLISLLLLVLEISTARNTKSKENIQSSQEKLFFSDFNSNYTKEIYSNGKT